MSPIHLHYLSMMKLLGSCFAFFHWSFLLLLSGRRIHMVYQNQFVRKIKPFRLWMRGFKTVHWVPKSNAIQMILCVVSQLIALREHDDIEFLGEWGTCTQYTRYPYYRACNFLLHNFHGCSLVHPVVNPFMWVIHFTLTTINCFNSDHMVMNTNDASNR